MPGAVVRERAGRAPEGAGLCRGPGTLWPWGWPPTPPPGHPRVLGGTQEGCCGLGGQQRAAPLRVPACACVCWRAFEFRRLYPGRGQVLVLARGGARPWLWEVSACLCSALCALPLRLLLLPWSAGAGTHPWAGQCSCRGPALLCLRYQGCPKFHVHTAACGLTYI